MLFATATVVSFYLGFALGKIIAWRRGGWTEYAGTIGGVTLYTVFTPWFALMMIWLFSFKAGWFPIGKFLNPVSCGGMLRFDANTVFLRMIITATVASLAIFVLFIVTSRRNGQLPRLLRFASIPVTLVAVLLVWLASGVGYLAWDIVKHMILPVATLTSDQLCRHNAADPQQHAGDHAGRLRDGGKSEGSAGARRPGQARC